MQSSLLAMFLAAAALVGCDSPGPKQAVAAERDPGSHVLMVGGTFRVGAPDWKLAQALYSEGGRIVAIGSEAQVRRRAREPFTTLDLGGSVAVPGLIDAHGHLEGLGKSLEEIDLRGVDSYAALISRVAARAAQVPAGTWIEGRGWDQNLWPDKLFPHHAELSRAVPDHPVLLSRIDGHAILVNAKALEIAGRAGVQADESPVAGGRMVLDGERKPTGVFVDNATGLIEGSVPEADYETRKRRMLLAAHELARNGLTGLHDMGEDQMTARILTTFAIGGELPIEVAGYVSQDWLVNSSSNRTSCWFGAVGPVEPLRYETVGAKLYMDGALGSRGAALLADYADEPGNRGLPMLSPEQLDELLAKCDENRLQPAIHAIGDLGNQRVLDAYQRRMAASKTFAELRPRIEHAQVVAPADWPRFAKLGVIPSMQPTHATSDMPWAPSRLGPERVQGAYAWRRLDPEGKSIAFGSDCPVELCDPLAGIYAAITCADSRGEPKDGYRPDQRLDAARALAGFTLNAARAANQEKDFGSLEPGHFANLTVLDLDPLTCAPSALLGGHHVRMTIVRGEVVYR
ncbi:MAG TPA: amidohydrolase family protein [Planctomycetota bacterium]|nr:amidohydrolase family protein [Planctomycetota bacterium]